MQATVVVSVSILDDDRFLLVQEGKEHCYRQWGLPGGRVEPGEPLLDAAVREVYEETGLSVRAVGMTRVVRYISQLGFHCVRFNFVAEVESGALVVNGEEILDARWLTFDEFDAVPDESIRTPAIARAIVRDVRDDAIYPMEFVLDALAPRESMPES